VLTVISEIREAWGEFYNDLYSPNDIDYVNHEFRDRVEASLANIDVTPSDDSVLLRDPITTLEVVQIIKKLKNKKAAGPDCIFPEHIKLGGRPTTLVQLITYLFNAMVNKEHRPADMKRGIIVPIPKGRKDSSLPENNRGITLSSIIGKMYDSILVNRSGDWLCSVIDDLQGAKHKHCSCNHTSMLLRETIAYGREVGRTVYTAFLDVRKAFDHVWTEGLFYKLWELKMDPKMWRIIRDAYDQFQCSVLIAGDTSQSFSPKQGLHQGDVWSMQLYCVYNNDLLKELKSSPYGVSLGDIKWTCPTFVDDISLSAFSKEALNRLLAIVNRYRITWRFEFGVSKSFVVISGTDRDPDVQVMIGDEVIVVTDTCGGACLFIQEL
jgi:hypothetical protein